MNSSINDVNNNFNNNNKYSNNHHNIDYKNNKNNKINDDGNSVEKILKARTIMLRLKINL
jgi:hypothetical protein